jgi:glycogen operon protein
MLSGGDEFRRTQEGNNNAYCQDNEISWFNWSHLTEHQEIYNFTRGLVAIRRDHPILSKEQFYTDAEIQWFSPHGELPNWNDSKNKQLACLIHENAQSKIYILFNAGTQGFDFILPTISFGHSWHLAVDTSHLFSQEIQIKDTKAYYLQARSCAILLIRKKDNS